jgi:peptidoglycan/LPS O-acetylase OafA/YrhL
MWSWLAIPYITISFATQSDKLFRVPWQIGDLSYGIYLFAFPIQQVLWQYYRNHLPILQVLALSAMITTLFAWAIWEVVEYPALKLKRKIKAHELINNRRPFFQKDTGL